MIHSFVHMAAIETTAFPSAFGLISGIFVLQRYDDNNHLTLLSSRSASFGHQIFVVLQSFGKQAMSADMDFGISEEVGQSLVLICFWPSPSVCWMCGEDEDRWLEGNPRLLDQSLSSLTIPRWPHPIV